MKFAGAMIFAVDLERMVRFYRDILGLRPIEATRLPDWVAFEVGGVDFALHAIPAPIARSIEVATPPEPRAQHPCKLSFAVADVGVEVARLKALGVELIQRPWGDWDVVDPEGNIIGLRGP